MRRHPQGTPEAYCPVHGEGLESPPDFLWQEYPDVCSKGKLDGTWIVNDKMVDRAIVEVNQKEQGEGGFYVWDDHIKNVYELLFAAMGDYRWTVVHNNKRFGFTDQATWKNAVDQLKALRSEALPKPEPTEPALS